MRFRVWQAPDWSLGYDEFVADSGYQTWTGWNKSFGIDGASCFLKITDWSPAENSVVVFGGGGPSFSIPGNSAPGTDFLGTGGSFASMAPNSEVRFVGDTDIWEVVVRGDVQFTIDGGVLQNTPLRFAPPNGEMNHVYHLAWAATSGVGEWQVRVNRGSWQDVQGVGGVLDIAPQDSVELDPADALHQEGFKTVLVEFQVKARNPGPDPADKATHWRARFEFSGMASVNGQEKMYALGTIEPLSVGAISQTDADTILAIPGGGRPVRHVIDFFKVDEISKANFVGRIQGQGVGNLYNQFEGSNSVGRSYMVVGGLRDPDVYEPNGPSYKLRIQLTSIQETTPPPETTIEEPIPPEEPLPPEPPEIEFPPPPETPLPPEPIPPEINTPPEKPEANEECACWDILAFIGDCVLEIPLSIYAAMTFAVELFGEVILVLTSIRTVLEGIGLQIKYVGDCLKFVGFQIQNLISVAVAIHPYAEGGALDTQEIVDKLGEIKDAVSDIPPCEVVVEHDQICNGEQEDHCPRQYDRSM